MKRVKIFLSLLFVSVALFGCSEDKVVFDNRGGSSMAAFDMVGEDFPVSNVTPASSIQIQVDVTTVSDTDRTFTVSADPSSTATPNMYSIDPASLVIKAGSYNGLITITGNYANLVNNSYKLVLKLDQLTGAYISKDGMTNTVILKKVKFLKFFLKQHIFVLLFFILVLLNY